MKTIQNIDEVAFLQGYSDISDVITNSEGDTESALMGMLMALRDFILDEMPADTHEELVLFFDKGDEELSHFTPENIFG